MHRDHIRQVRAPFLSIQEALEYLQGFLQLSHLAAPVLAEVKYLTDSLAVFNNIHLRTSAPHWHHVALGRHD